MRNEHIAKMLAVSQDADRLTVTATYVLYLMQTSYMAGRGVGLMHGARLRINEVSAESLDCMDDARDFAERMYEIVKDATSYEQALADAEALMGEIIEAAEA